MSNSKLYHHDTSYSQDEQNELTLNDIKKFETLWKDVKENRRNLENMKTALIKKGTKRNSVDIKPSSTNQEVFMMQKENLDLKDKLKYCQIQLNEMKDQNMILIKKLKEAEIEIEKCHNKITKQMNLNAIQNNHINEMTIKVDNMSYSQKELIEKSREANKTLLDELEDKNNEISNLKDMLKEKTEKLSIISVTYDQNNFKLTQCEKTILEKDNEIENLKTKLEDADKENYELILNKKSEGAALLEIEHLRNDVKRLVKMLKNTKEYKDFADFADDNAGSIRFIKHNKLTSLDLDYEIPRGGSCSPAQSKNKSFVSRIDLVDEKEVWVPEEAYKFVKEFRKKYEGELTNDLIEKLLFELNRIWSKREQQQINRVKSQCAAEIQKLKRKIKYHPSYDATQAKTTIERLKQQLKNSYTIQREMHQDRPSKNPFGIKYINESMRMANDFDQAKKELKSENNFLRNQIRPSTASSQTGISNLQFKELISEYEEFKKRLLNLINEFSSKRKDLLNTFDGKPDLSLLLRKEDWFLESLEAILRTLNSDKWKK